MPHRYVKTVALTTKKKSSLRTNHLGNRKIKSGTMSFSWSFCFPLKRSYNNFTKLML